jgi:hypothetical protein
MSFFLLGGTFSRLVGFWGFYHCIATCFCFFFWNKIRERRGVGLADEFYDDRPGAPFLYLLLFFPFGMDEIQEEKSTFETYRVWAFG